MERLAGHTLRLRTASSTYVLFTLIFGTLMALFAAGAIGHPSLWQAVALWAAVLGGLILHFSRLEVTVSHGSISYRNLFGRRSLLLSDIAHSEIGWRIAGRDHRPLLVITPAHGGKALSVNLKPYRRVDIAKLLAMPELKLRQSD